MRGAAKCTPDHASGRFPTEACLHGYSAGRNVMTQPWPAMVRVRFDRGLKITLAEGDAPTVFGRATNDVVGTLLHEALHVPKEQLQTLTEQPDGSVCFLSRLEGNRHHYLRATLSSGSG